MEQSSPLLIILFLHLYMNDEGVSMKQDWAIYGSKEEGFDPADVRIKRTKQEKNYPEENQFFSNSF